MIIVSFIGMEERKVSKAWIDAIATIVPIPKKGGLKNCNNWRGIALMEVVGNTATGIIQDRSQKVEEWELPEFKCGLRGGIGCIDMTFTVKHLV